MDCKTFERCIQNYLEGIPDKKFLREMEEHRVSCAVCAKTLALNRYVIEALTSAEHVKAPAGLAERILAAAEAETATVFVPVKPWYTRATFIPVAAAVVCIAGALVNIAHSLLATGEITAVSETASSRFVSLAYLAQNSIAQLYTFVALQWGRLSSETVMIPNLHVSIPLFILALSPLTFGLLAWSAWSYFASPVAPGVYAAAGRRM